MNSLELKESLLANCFEYVETRKKKLLATISAIEESLLEEGKSTAGDRHHTERAMLQIDRENTGKQLLELEHLETILPKISIGTLTGIAHLGSLVITEKASYFLSISTGAVDVNGTTYYCVSTRSPIGKLLLGKKVGDRYSFQNEWHRIIGLE